MEDGTNISSGSKTFVAGCRDELGYTPVAAAQRRLHSGHSRSHFIATILALISGARFYSPASGFFGRQDVRGLP